MLKVPSLTSVHAAMLQDVIHGALVTCPAGIDQPEGIVPEDTISANVTPFGVKAPEETVNPVPKLVTVVVCHPWLAVVNKVPEVGRVRDVVPESVTVKP